MGMNIDKICNTAQKTKYNHLPIGVLLLAQVSKDSGSGCTAFFFRTTSRYTIILAERSAAKRRTHDAMFRRTSSFTSLSYYSSNTIIMMCRFRVMGRVYTRSRVSWLK